MIKFVSKPFNLDLLDLFFTEGLDMPTTTNKPEYDIIEDDSKYQLDLMLSGFDKENVNLKVEENTLIIEGERKIPEENKYSRKGSFFGEFKKSFTLPDNILTDKIDASFKNGILSIEIPKNVEKELSKKIVIK